jgi:hypothetical protein
MSALPTFLVIGAMKAGTYSLHNYLHRHPQIEMSQRRKEVNFFIDSFNWARGLAWYQAHWRGDTPMRGESSTRYTMRDKFPEVSGRIHQLLPDARLIYLVRDPIRRLLSQYVHEVDDNQEFRSFEALLAAPDRDLVLNTGRYHYQLQAYLRYFAPESIHVACFEDLVAQPVETMQTILRFLGVDAGFSDPSWTQAHNDSADKRQETPSGRVVRKLVGRRPIRRNAWLRDTFTRPIPRPQFDPVRHADIVALYREDTEQLARLTGRSFTHWRGIYGDAASPQITPPPV